MISNQTTETALVSAPEAAVLWNMPWHARLKILAEALRPGLVQVPHRPAGSVHTWLERIRITS